MLFAAGKFIDIGASDLIPEDKAHADAGVGLIRFGAFAAGAALMLMVRLALEP